MTISTSTNASSVTVLLDSRLVDFSKPITLSLNGANSSHKLQPSLLVLGETLLRRGDPELAFTAQLSLPLVPAAEVPKPRAERGGR